jgi:low affinity Fe/Cu permease
MTLFIQRAETRDTQAIHAKLDELLRAEEHARKELTKLDEQEPKRLLAIEPNNGTAGKFPVLDRAKQSAPRSS